MVSSGLTQASLKQCRLLSSKAWVCHTCQPDLKELWFWVLVTGGVFAGLGVLVCLCFEASLSFFLSPYDYPHIQPHLVLTKGFLLQASASAGTLDTSVTYNKISITCNTPLKYFSLWFAKTCRLIRVCSSRLHTWIMFLSGFLSRPMWLCWWWTPAEGSSRPASRQVVRPENTPCWCARSVSLSWL